MLAVARLDHHVVGLGTHYRLESPVLDFEDDDAQVWTDHREIRVTIADTDVVIDEIVVGEVSAERGKNLALAAGDGVVLFGKALGDGERHVPILPWRLQMR